MVLGKRERKVERNLGKEVGVRERGVRSILFLFSLSLFWGRWEGERKRGVTEEEIS